MNTLPTITAREVEKLLRAGHVVYGYPRRGEIVVDGWKRFRPANQAALKAAIC